MKLAIMGSTGSIGTQALDIIKDQPIQVVGLTCGRNDALLLEQYHCFKPEMVVVDDLEAFNRISEALANEPVKVAFGLEGLIEMATHLDYDVLLTSVVGAVGLKPTVAAVARGKRIALANKETLVVYGEVIMPMAKAHGAQIIPVDSEHSALFQALQGNRYEAIDRLILTASGGPFRNMTPEALESVTHREALKHPKWQMGAKISIDSATLMNKGLEVIEAHWLFGVPPERIEVVVHPQSIIHSIVEYHDGSMIAQMGLPDMKLPIHYALHYPERVVTALPRLSLSHLGQMTFQEPDRSTFPCLDLAYKALSLGGTSPCILNAANEVLVERFLKEDIRFYDIPKGIEAAMDHFGTAPIIDLDQILDLDNAVREFTSSMKF